MQVPWRTEGCAADAVRIVGGGVASVPWRWRGVWIVSGGAASCATVWVRVSVRAVACMGKGGHAAAQPSWAAGGTTADAVRVVGGAVVFVLLRWCGGSVASGGVVTCAIMWVRASVWAVVREGDGGRATVQAPRRTEGCAADAVRIAGGDVVFVPLRRRGGLIAPGGAASCATVWVRVSVWAVVCVGEGGHVAVQSPWTAGGITADAVRIAGGNAAFVLLRWCGGLVASGGAVTCAIVWVRVSVRMGVRVFLGGVSAAWHTFGEVGLGS